MNKFGQSFGAHTGGGLLLPGENISQTQSAYAGADGGARYRHWTPADTDADTATQQSIDGLRSRSRQQIQDNPVATSASNQYVTNVVGVGMAPRLVLKDQGLQEEIQNWWRYTEHEIDFHENTTFGGLQAIAVRGVFDGGENLARRRFRPRSSGLDVPLQVELIEGDYLPHNLNKTLDNGHRIKQGIEYNRGGKRTAYHLHEHHPGELNAGFGLANSTRPVKAGDIHHMFRVLRSGQRRGVPRLHAALRKLYDLEQYQDAELERKKQAAMFVGFISSQLKDLEPSDLFPKDKDARRHWSDLRDDYYDGFKVKAGTYGVLGPGDSVDFNSPSDVAGNYLQHVHEIKREIAAAGDITFEQLTGYMRDTNYASARVRLIDIRRGFEMDQQHMLALMCGKIWRWRFTAAIASGRLVVPDFHENPYPYLNPIWVPHAFPSVDPLKDVMCDMLEVRGGLDSRSNKQAKRGRDPQVVSLEIQRDNAEADDKGFIFDTDPRHTAKSGAIQQIETGAINEGVANRGSNQPQDDGE